MVSLPLYITAIEHIKETCLLNKLVSLKKKETEDKIRFLRLRDLLSRHRTFSSLFGLFGAVSQAFFVVVHNDVAIWREIGLYGWPK